MTIVAEWDDDIQSVIRLIYCRPLWEWHEFYAAFERVRDMVGTSPDMDWIGFIIDVTNGSLPPGVFLSKTKILYEIKQHPAVVATVVVGADRFAQALYDVTNHDVPARQRYTFVPTLDEAHEAIARARDLKHRQAG